jgi:histidine triad (HIT) family protein
MPRALPEPKSYLSKARHGMTYDYDDQNIFAKILRGEIPNSTVLETEHSLAFADIAPQAPTHILVIPKGAYVNYDDFAANASDAEIADFTRAVGKVCAQSGAAQSAGGNGYRLLSNAGSDGVQDVPHLHVHVVAGKRLGRMLP